MTKLEMCSESIESFPVWEDLQYYDEGNRMERKGPLRPQPRSIPEFQQGGILYDWAKTTSRFHLFDTQSLFTVSYEAYKVTTRTYASFNGRDRLRCITKSKLVFRHLTCLWGNCHNYGLMTHTRYSMPNGLHGNVGNVVRNARIIEIHKKANMCTTIAFTF